MQTHTTTKHPIYTAIFALFVALLTPLHATMAAPTSAFSADGLYGCAGSPENTVGYEHAGGIFVPVAERAVSHNTNVLVFKECVADRLVARLKEVAVGQQVRSIMYWVRAGNNGKPAFITNQVNFRRDVTDKVLKEFIEGPETEAVCEPYKQDLRRALAIQYAQIEDAPGQSFACAVSDDKKERFNNMLNGTAQFTLDDFAEFLKPQNNPFMVYALATQRLADKMDEKLSDEYRELDWGDGYRSHKQCRQLPVGNGAFEEYCEIKTPGTTIKNIINFSSNTGLRQIENADEIDELVGSMMRNMQTRILSGVGGMLGVSEAGDGGSAYVDELVSESARRARMEHVNVGNGALAGYIQAETAYKVAREGQANAFETTAKQLEDKDKLCWDGIIAAAVASTTADVVQMACDARNNGLGGGNNNYCTIRGTTTVTIATSTIHYIDPQQAQQDGTGPKEYDVILTGYAADKKLVRVLHIHPYNSYNIIKERIAPHLRLARMLINEAQKALEILQNLQEQLAINTSPAGQRSILQQINELMRPDPRTGRSTLHNSGDVVQAEQELDATREDMRNLYHNTEQAWDAGWCRPQTWRDYLK